MDKLEMLQKIKDTLEGQTFTYKPANGNGDPQPLSVKESKFYKADGEQLRLPGVSWVYLYNLYADENGITEKLTEPTTVQSGGGTRAPRSSAPKAPKKPQGPSDPNGNTPDRITYYTTPAQKAIITSLDYSADEAAAAAAEKLKGQWEGKMDKPTNAYLSLEESLALGKAFETDEASKVKGINSLKSKTEWIKSIQFSTPEGETNGQEAESGDLTPAEAETDGQGNSSPKAEEPAAE